MFLPDAFCATTMCSFISLFMQFVRPVETL
jgi:hypothetical protein